MSSLLAALAANPVFVGCPVPIFVCYAESATLVAVNPAATLRYGYTGGEWLAMTSNVVWKDMGAGAASLLRASGARWSFRTKAGEPVVAEVSVAPAVLAGHTLYLMFAHDITREAALEQGTRSVEHRVERLQDALAAAAAVPFMVDRHLNVTFPDEVSSQRLGLPPGVNVPLHQLVSSEQLPRALNAVAALLRGATTGPLELDVLSPTGTQLAMEVRARVSHRQGVVSGLEGIATDIRERRSLQERTAHEQRMATLGRLAAALAHDFNNLLTIMLGYADDCADATDETQRRASIEQVRSAAERAAILTRRLLAFSRKQTALPRPIDLSRVVREVAPMIERLVGDRVQVHYALATDLPPIVADPVEIDQALLNLTANARDAMPDGGTLHIATALVPPADGAEPAASAMVELAVRDTGHGMTAEVRRRAFEPYFTTKGPARGTGLGLGTVAAAASNADGRVSLASEPGVGTTVGLAFPARRDATVDPWVVEDEPAARGGAETVLVVEDDPDVRAILVRTLSTRGYDIRAVAGAADADLAARQGRPPALLVTEVVLPDSDGTALADRLRARMPGLRVLYLSARIQPGQDRGESGTVLAKPFTGEQLARRVRTVLDASSA
jgi:signal transduction histidine kinase/CheY-like chemotaxis protein